jgi:glycosyltransferase involved in cell wall biosynthesis
VLDAASLGEQIVDGETGFLVPPSDDAIFSQRVSLLLTDEALRQRLSGATKDRIDRLFRWDRTVSRILDIYEDVVRTHNSARTS